MSHPTSGAAGNSAFESFGRKVEEDLQRAIAYLNDEVVPQARRHSSEALRTAAEQLGRLATHLNKGSGR